MAQTDIPDITRLLADWRNGDAAALDRMTPLVYQELRRLASACMHSERPEHTLQPTALVHEAYLRLFRQQPAIANRAHFFAMAARLMRQVLVDFARARQADKRGAALTIRLEDDMDAAAPPTGDLLDLHEAIERLGAVDARKARVIELRYFGGLSRDEVAEALSLTLATVKRDLSLAEAWLRRDLDRAAPVTR